MKKILIIILSMFMISMSFAVDFNNITFTNEEFYNGAITDTKVLELSNGKLVVAYANGGFSYMKICDLDGTNCGSQVQATWSGGKVSMDIFEDTTNNKIVYIEGNGGSNSGYKTWNLDLTGGSTPKTFNAASTNYVSAVQTNSSDFAIAFQDTGDSSKGKLIICKLDGSSCGSEVTFYASVVEYNKIIKTSSNKIAIAYERNNLNLYLELFDLDLTGQTTHSIQSGATSYIDMIEGSDNKLKFVYQDGGNSNRGTFRSCDLDGTNCGSEIVFNTYTSQYLNINELNEKLFLTFREGTTIGDGRLYNFNLLGGDISLESFFSNGTVAQYINTIITSDNQIISSYKGVGDKGMFAISEEFSSGATITFNSPIQDEYLNSTSIDLNVSFSLITNSTYQLNGGTETTLGTNTNETTTTLTGVEGINNLTVFTNTTGELSNSSINFNIDLTAPNISIIGNLSQPQFEVNFSTIFNVTDEFSGIASCTLNATYLENITNASQYDRFVNCSDTETFSAAGLYNGFIIATDNAGNVATLSVNGTIEPFVLINFFDENSTAVTNYYGEIRHPSGFIDTFSNTSNPLEISPFFQGNLDLGNYTIIFSKVGYDTTNISIDINISSGGTEYNFSVPGARINLRIFDITDYTIINTSNTTIEIIGDSFSEIYATSDGLLNITSLEMEEETYTVIISNPSYETSTTSFNYNNQEVLTVDAYLTPLTVNGSLIADVIVRGVDDYGSPLRGFTVLQYVWDSGQSKYVQSNLKTTDYDGETSFKVFLNTKLYNFCIDYQGILYCENDVSVNINTDDIVIDVPISELSIRDPNIINDINFSYSLTNTTIDLITFNVTSVNFNYNNPNQNVDEYCLKIYEINKLKRTLVANQCDVLHTTGLSVNIVENTSKNYVAVATIEVDDNIRVIDELPLYATFTLQDELDDYGLVKIVLLVLVSFIIAVSIHKKVHRIGIAHFGLPIVFLGFSAFFPKYISFESFVLVLIVNIFAWALVTRKDDLQKEKSFNTLNVIIALYMIFIFGLFTALTEMDDKGFLDDYGEVILDNIAKDNSYFKSFANDKIDNLKTQRAGANTGAWDLLTGIFLKTLEFIDVFFSILSNLFDIATNISLIIGIRNALLLQVIKIIDYLIVSAVVYFYFKEAFK